MGFGVVAEGSSLRVADADEDGGVPVEKFSPCLGGFVRGGLAPQAMWRSSFV
jgi:hypothetical protein